jgi:hypothetical protein
MRLSSTYGLRGDDAKHQGSVDPSGYILLCL